MKYICTQIISVTSSVDLVMSVGLSVYMRYTILLMPFSSPEAAGRTDIGWIIAKGNATNFEQIVQIGPLYK